MAQGCKQLEARADELQRKSVLLMRAVNQLKEIYQCLEDAYVEVKHSGKCLEETCNKILSDPELFIDLTHDSDHEDVSPVECCPVRSINIAPSGNYDGQIFQYVDCSRWVSNEEPNLGFYMNEHSDTPNLFLKDVDQFLVTDVKNCDPHQQVFTSLCNPPNQQDNEALLDIVDFLKSDRQCLASTKETFQNTSYDNNSQPAFSDSDAVVLVDDLTWKPNTVITSNQEAHSPDSGYDSDDRTDSPSLPSNPKNNQIDIHAQETEASANNNKDGVFIFNAEMVENKPFILNKATYLSEMAQLKEETRCKRVPCSSSLSCNDDQCMIFIEQQENLFYSKDENSEVTKTNPVLYELTDLNSSRVKNETNNIVVFGEQCRSPDIGFDSDGCSDISSSPPDWQMSRGNSKFQQVVIKRSANSNTTYILMPGNSRDIEIPNCNLENITRQTRSIPIPEKNYRKRTSNLSMVRTHENRDKVKRRECFKRCTVLSENRGDKTDYKNVTSLPVNNDSNKNNQNHNEYVANVSDTLQKLTLTENNSASQLDENSDRQVKNGTKYNNNKTVVTTLQKTNKNSFVDTVLEKDNNNLQTNTTYSNTNRTISTNTTAENKKYEINRQVAPGEVKGDPINKTDIECVLESTSQKQTSESRMQRVNHLHKKTDAQSRNARDNSNSRDEVSDVAQKIKHLSL